jgi:hypothetical protein
MVGLLRSLCNGTAYLLELVQEKAEISKSRLTVTEEHVEGLGNWNCSRPLSGHLVNFGASL